MPSNGPIGSSKRYRQIPASAAVGLSRSQLVKASGVGVRSIQLYEQRQKDINKAQGIALYRLSRALRCTMEQLLER